MTELIPEKTLPLHGLIAFFCATMFLVTCNVREKEAVPDLLAQREVQVHHASGFRIYSFAKGKVLRVNGSEAQSSSGGWIGLAKDQKSMHDLKEAFKSASGKTLDITIQVPVKRIVSNSTTHVAALDRIGALDRLVGFAHIDLISTPEARSRIEAGEIEEMGVSGSLDPERLLQLSPDVVLSFEVKGEARAMNTVRNADIPVLNIGEWLEDSPLGRAEWLRVFGLLTGKEEQSEKIFSSVEKQYMEIKDQAAKAGRHPRVISGSLFKDVFYAPGPENWMAKLIRDAGGTYLWEDQSGSGSLHLSAEDALRHGINANIWIGAGQYNSLEELRASNPLIGELPCVADGRVYGYMGSRGATGGVLFFEEAAFYPDRLISDVYDILKYETIGAPLSDLHYFAPLRP